MTVLRITIGDRAQLREDTLQFVQDVEAGDTEAHDDRVVLQFGSYEDLVSSLTPVRLELITAIATEHPESMRGAARLVDRDVSDVHGDLKHLEVLGVLELEDGGPGGAIKPIVPFDTIEIHIDYPLVEAADTDSSPASAD